MRVLLPALVPLLLAAPVARAQSTSPSGTPFDGAVTAGARVRVTLPDSVRQGALLPHRQAVVGTVARVAGDTLVLEVPSARGTLAVARGDLRALAVSRGVPGRAESALREGLNLAIGVGLAFAIVRTSDDRDARPFRSAGEAALAGGAIGFGTGALLGAVRPSERWRAVRLR
jgi:hypothetical protein